MLYFNSDYLEGAHPAVLQRLLDTNLEQTVGYGQDAYCAQAKDKIRAACHCPNAQVEFLVGGTQTNATVIRSLLRPYQGVLAADTGHIALHEAGAIEAGGHKVLTVPQHEGKVAAADLTAWIEKFYRDGSWDHMVCPGMVYISHPTEYGTLYTKAELEAIRAVCDRYQLYLYLDGARLGYGLAAHGTDVTLPDLAELCDIFYIGGTKGGALFGEAVVVPQADLIPHVFTQIKQNGALLAKGRLLGLQFDALFTDGLYWDISRHAIAMAEQLKNILRRKGYRFYLETPTNQQFVVVENGQMEELAKKVSFGFWEELDETHTVIRFATSWATRPESLAELERLL